MPASFRFVSAALVAYTTRLASNTSSLPTAVLLPCTHFVSGLFAGEVTDHDLRMSLFRGDAEGYALVQFAPCTLPRSSQATLLALCRTVLPLPDDTILIAVSVKGIVFLEWVQQVLSAAPFFMQSAQVVVGRDLNREFDCQINHLQVWKWPPALPTLACEPYLACLHMQIESRTFSPTEVFRLVTTATLLKSAASKGILGNETVAKAFQSPLDGIVDAVADAINARTSTPAPNSEIFGFGTGKGSL